MCRASVANDADSPISRRMFTAILCLGAAWTALLCAYRAGRWRHFDDRRAGCWMVAAWLFSLVAVAL